MATTNESAAITTPDTASLISGRRSGIAQRGYPNATYKAAPTVTKNPMMKPAAAPFAPSEAI